MRRMISGMTSEGILSHFPGRGLVEMDRLGRLRSSSIRRRMMSEGGPDHARYIAARLGGPKALHWLNDSYHMIHVDKEHRKVADLSTRFFEMNYASRNAI